MNATHTALTKSFSFFVNIKIIAKKQQHHHLWHLESLSGKFRYRNQTNILILSWSNFFQKSISKSNPDLKKMASILQDIKSWSCPCSPLICARRTTTHLFIWQQQKCGPVSGSPMQRGAIGEHYQTPHFNPRHRHPPVMTVKTARVRLNRLRTGVWRFRSCLHKWVMILSAACECGAEEQNIGRVIFTVQPMDRMA